MNRPFYAISKKKSYAEIKIYGIIGYDWFTGVNNSAASFISEFQAIEQEFDDIRVRINSPGGDIAEGLPIFNHILQSKKATKTIVDGIAMSMGAVIAFTGKTVSAPKPSIFMIHGASTITMGNAQDHRETADVLDKWNDVLIAGIASARGLKEEDVRAKWFDGKDHYLTAEEALAEGLIDEILDAEADVPENIEAMDYKQILAAYRNASPRESVWERGTNRIAALFNPRSHSNSQPNPDNSMKNAICALVGLAFAASEEEVVTRIKAQLDERNEFKAKFEKAEAERVAAVAQVAERDTTITTLQAKLDKKPAGNLGNAGGPDTPPEGGEGPEDTFTDPVTAYANSMKV